MAEKSPIGTATSMAMPVMSSVPVKTGTAPKEPELPT